MHTLPILLVDCLAPHACVTRIPLLLCGCEKSAAEILRTPDMGCKASFLYDCCRVKLETAYGFKAALCVADRKLVKPD